MNSADLEYASMTPGETPETIKRALESAGMTDIDITVVGDRPLEEKPEEPAEQTTSSAPPEESAGKDKDAGGTTGSQSGTGTEPVQKQEQEPQKKHSGSAKLKAQRDEARTKLAERERELEELRKKLAAAPARPESPPAPASKPAQETAKPNPKPKSEEFENYDDYVEALTDWKSEERARKRQEAATLQAEQEAEQTARTQAQKASELELDDRKAYQERWQRQILDAKAAHDDFDEVLRVASEEAPDNSYSAAMDAALHDLELGGEVLYYLGQHVEEARRIFKLTHTPVNSDGSFQERPSEVRRKIAIAVRELSKIEDKLVAQRPENEEDEEVETEAQPPAATPVQPAPQPVPPPQPQAIPKQRPAPPNPVGNRGIAARKTPLDMKPEELRTFDPESYRKFREGRA